MKPQLSRCCIDRPEQARWRKLVMSCPRCFARQSALRFHQEGEVLCTICGAVIPIPKKTPPREVYPNA